MVLLSAQRGGIALVGLYYFGHWSKTEQLGDPCHGLVYKGLIVARVPVDFQEIAVSVLRCGISPWRSAQPYMWGADHLACLEQI